MKLCKVDTRLIACFSLDELVNLLLHPIESSLVKKMLNGRLKREKAYDNSLDGLVKKWSKDSANSKDYEYWFAIFSLYDDFGDGSEVCFYLKDSFNPNQDEITCYADLEKFKQDPPDVIIKNKMGGYAEFELKRYRGDLNKKKLIAFIESKIMCYSIPFNYCIVLQHESGTALPQTLFENLHQELKKLSIKKDLGSICFVFNANNEDLVFAHVYPSLNVYKKPFINGSSQVKKLLSAQ